MHDRARIRQLRAAGMPAAAIAAELGASRSSVYRALDPAASVRYSRARAIDVFGANVERLLEAYPLMDAPTLATVVGWPRSLRQLEKDVVPIRRRARQAGRAGVLRPARVVDGRVVLQAWKPA